jgi:hypothetical protein
MDDIIDRRAHDRGQENLIHYLLRLNMHNYAPTRVIDTATQSILEKCCYKFARKWFPSKLENTGRNCAEAVELT